MGSWPRAARTQTWRDRGPRDHGREPSKCPLSRGFVRVPCRQTCIAPVPPAAAGFGRRHLRNAPSHERLSAPGRRGHELVQGRAGLVEDLGGDRPGRGRQLAGDPARHSDHPVGQRRRWTRRAGMPGATARTAGTARTARTARTAWTARTARSVWTARTARSVWAAAGSRRRAATGAGSVPAASARRPGARRGSGPAAGHAAGAGGAGSRRPASRGRRRTAVPGDRPGPDCRWRLHDGGTPSGRLVSPAGCLHRRWRRDPGSAECLREVPDPA
jgi:hypothetical protein